MCNRHSLLDFFYIYIYICLHTPMNIYIYTYICVYVIIMYVCVHVIILH